MSELGPPGPPPLGPPPPGPPPSLPPGPPPPGPPDAPRDRGTVVALAAIASAAMLVLAIGIPVAVTQMRADEQREIEATLAEVVTVEDLSTEHTDGDVTYPHVPPIGGPHAPVWLDCGVYDEPVREENAVHDLEHGTVWITHDPDLAEEDLELLAAALPDNGIMSPHPDLPAPVVVTVWGRQLRLTGADDPRLALFVRRLGAGETAPEPFASCAGGTPDPQGGGEPESEGTEV